MNTSLFSTLYTLMKIKVNKICLLYRQLAMMRASGIPVSEALDTLINQTQARGTNRILSALKEKVETDSIAGRPRRYPKYYNEALVHVLKTEKQGKTAAAFLYAFADELERSEVLKKRIMSSFTYPVVIFVITILLSMFLFIFVIPVFEDIFSSLGGSLPPATRLFIDFSHFVSQHAVIVFAMVAIIFMILIWLRKFLYMPLPFIPVVRTISKKIAIMQFTKQLSLLLPIQMPFKDVIKYAAMAIDNTGFKQKLSRMADGIIDVNQLKEAMQETKVFPDIVLLAVDSGRKANALETVFGEVARYYEKETEVSLSGLLMVVDTLALLLVGCIVGLIVIAMYQPIFSLAGQLG